MIQQFILIYYSLIESPFSNLSFPKNNMKHCIIICSCYYFRTSSIRQVSKVLGFKTCPCYILIICSYWYGAPRLSFWQGATPNKLYIFRLMDGLYCSQLFSYKCINVNLAAPQKYVNF